MDSSRASPAAPWCRVPEADHVVTRPGEDAASRVSGGSQEAPPASVSNELPTGRAPIALAESEGRPVSRTPFLVAGEASGQLSVIVIPVMLTGWTGRSCEPVGAFAIASITSSPALSLPKIV